MSVARRLFAEVVRRFDFTRSRRVRSTDLYLAYFQLTK